MFKVGQRVVSLNNSVRNNRKKGDVYIITWEHTCSCGQQLVAWGEKHGMSNAIYVCHKCSSDTPSMGEWATGAENFAPIQEYGDSMSIAMESIQDMERVDKPVNPVKEKEKV